jgi:hypothetical protein
MSPSPVAGNKVLLVEGPPGQMLPLFSLYVWYFNIVSLWGSLPRKRSGVVRASENRTKPGKLSSSPAFFKTL